VKDHPNKAYRSRWLSLVIDFGMGCTICGILLIVFGLPQVSFPVFGGILIIVGLAIGKATPMLERWDERNTNASDQRENANE
jgi:hypothetical protein